MECCIESVIGDFIKSISVNSVCDRVYPDRKECGDDQSYVVFKVRTLPGLRTTSGVQRLHGVQILGYFSNRNEARQFRDAIEQVLFVNGCIDMSDCGCLCPTEKPSVSLSPAPKDKWQVVAAITGAFHENQSGS